MYYTYIGTLCSQGPPRLHNIGVREFFGGGDGRVLCLCRYIENIMAY